MAAGGEDMLARQGLRAMAPGQAVAVLGQAAVGGNPVVLVADVDWGRFVPGFTIARPSPLIAGVAEARQAAEAAVAAPAPAGRGLLAGRLAGLDAAGQERVLLEVVRAEAAAVLGHPSPEAVPPGAVFRDLGFDSLTALEMRQAMSAATGLRLPATLVFDYPTPDALARYLRGELTPDGEGATLPLLTELDKLESMVSAIAAGERARVATRLEGLLAKLKTAEAQVDDGAAAPELGQATAEELFELIDTEFGGR
jgi:acyl carrier protein